MSYEERIERMLKEAMSTEVGIKRLARTFANMRMVLYRAGIDERLEIGDATEVLEQIDGLLFEAHEVTRDDILEHTRRLNPYERVDEDDLAGLPSLEELKRRGA